MRKKLLIVAVMFVLMLPASVWAVPQPPGAGWAIDYTGSITMGNEIYSYNGGPFYSILDGSTVPAYCVEMGVYFNPGWTYKVDLYKDIGPVTDSSTDWFWQATYIIDQHGLALNQNDQMATQYAVWYLNHQVQFSDESLGLPVIPDGLQPIVVSFLGENPKLMSWSDAGYRYADLFNTVGSEAQDQIVPTPEPTTMLLLGLGLIGVAGIRRKFKS
jgi:hypothetical protein